MEAVPEKVQQVKQRAALADVQQLDLKQSSNKTGLMLFKQHSLFV